ncbi:hypothetical protein IYR97_08020 [Pseudomonas fulva]|uniref:Uncharacterized protein n=1 Tax=Pseudomonas fulva TaxID=47880 RepID=A0A7S9LKS5_9PSED|nr:hypothetical protein [Pseudomonas fulva]QPH45550.1 hypothetical protein IYR97_08020 [Pseudomonas fulva]QPH50635.1 hypothetical protein IZU98_08035 [Pseudomonas fulva]
MKIVEQMVLRFADILGFDLMIAVLGDSVQASPGDRYSSSIQALAKKDRVSIHYRDQIYHIRSIHRVLSILTNYLSLQHRADLFDLVGASTSPITHFVDFEASGIAPDSYPVEIAVVHPGGEYQALIKPVRYWQHWSYDAQDMHQISRDQLMAEGKPAATVAQELNELFAGLYLVSDAGEDSYWLEALYEAAELDPTFAVTTVEQTVGPEHAAAIYYQMPVARGHRALADATALRDTVERHYRIMRLLDINV